MQCLERRSLSSFIGQSRISKNKLQDYIQSTTEVEQHIQIAETTHHSENPTVSVNSFNVGNDQEKKLMHQTYCE